MIRQETTFCSLSRRDALPSFSVFSCPVRHVSWHRLACRTSSICRFPGTRRTSTVWSRFPLQKVLLFERPLRHWTSCKRDPDFPQPDGSAAVVYHNNRLSFRKCLGCARLLRPTCLFTLWPWVCRETLVEADESERKSAIPPSRMKKNLRWRGSWLDLALYCVGLSFFVANTPLAMRRLEQP